MTTILVQAQKLLVPSLDLSREHEHGVELALSDLHTFFATLLVRLADETNVLDNDVGTPTRQRIPDITTRRRQKSLAAVNKKLAFYIAAARAIRRQSGRRVWIELSAEVGKEIEKLRSQVEDEEGAKMQDRCPAGFETHRMDSLSILDRSRASPADSSSATAVVRIEEL